jgi:hypothetical protein
MAMEPESWFIQAITGGRTGSRAKPKRHDDLYLCVALVVLLAWALLSVIF